MSNVGHFDICKEMAKRGMDIRMSLLENLRSLTYSKRTQGTTVSISIDGNLVAAIGIEQKFIGGLLLCDRQQYLALAEELRNVESTKKEP